MSIVNRLDVVQRPVEERRQLVLLAPGGERRHELVQVEVPEEQGS